MDRKSLEKLIYIKRWTKYLVWGVSICVWLVLARMCIQAALFGETFKFQSGDTVYITFFIFPFLLLGGLYGYLIALGTFTLSFITTLIFDMDNSYKMAIHLVATICFALYSQYGYFETKKKTMMATLGTVIATSATEFACLTVLEEESFSEFSFFFIIRYFYRDIGIILLMAFILFYFFNKAPDLCKMPFPLGIGYTKAFKENKEIKRKIRKTRVSMKLTTLIIGLEVILAIFVAVYMMVLFPDIKHMIISSFKDIHGETMGIATGKFDANEVIEGLNELDYRLDFNALRFDIKMMLMMLCVGVPLAGFANFYTKTTIGEPLGIMSDFMEEYAESDDDKKLEVGRKIDTINFRTKDEIEVVNESIKETVHAIEDYITHIKAEQELQKELEVAQKASEAKSSFLSNMSHEIRTPINAVLGMNEMILRESKDEQILEYAQNVKSAGSSLLSIINDILDFSKIEAGKMDILPVEYNLSSMVNDLVNMISAKASDKGIELEVNVDPRIPDKLFGDEVRIKQCVTNVLTNAVKYTEKGTVTMNVSYRESDEENIYLKFQVVDTGIGIKEEDLKKLFSPFERIEEIRNRTIEGTGLGMSIVKKLLAMMDTKLEVKSVYGKGSDFSFEVVQKVVSFEEIGDFKEKYKEYLKGIKGYHEKFHAPDAEILVVDDTAMNLTVVKGLLKSTKVKVDTAESGREALSKVQKKKYDAIFIDHRMPEMDGIQTLEAMKKLENNMSKDVACIALTANAGANARDEYIGLGFDDYLAKPVNGEIMEDMLRHYLPEDKILSSDEGQIEGADAANSGTAESDGQTDDGGFLSKLQGIDLAEAEKNCGSRDILIDVVKQFHTSISAKADNIEKFADERDFRNYTVAVHALKSSARLVGAMELSGQAAYLEQCGNDENDSEIQEKTPALLQLYRSYLEKLSAADENEDDSNLPEIGEEELSGAFSDMKELLEAYDFDTADGIMNMLADYRVPDSYKDKYDKVKELMAAVDRDKLLEIL